MIAAGVADRLPSDEELVVFFEQLRRDGYRLVPAQLDAALRVIRHARSGAPDAPSAGRLAYSLTPIFATTPGEQADLYRRLAAWRAPTVLGRVEPAEPEPVMQLPEVARHGRVWPVVAVAAALLAAWLVAAWWFATPPEPVTELPPASVPQRAGDPPLRQETITTVFLETSPAYPWIKWGLIGLPLVPFGCWLVLRWRWRQLWLRRGRSEAELDPLDLGPRPAGTALFADPEVGRTAQQWRRFRRLPTRDLDADRTIDATVAQAGLFTAVFRTRPVSPEYVVLIEEATRHDHLARLADLAIHGLAAEGVPIERYYFDGSIEHLRRPGSAPTPLSLGELEARSPHRSLIVVGSGDDLFAPLTARLDPRTVQALDPWPHRAFLSQRPIAAWSDREQALLDSGMALATASRNGLRALGDQLAQAQSGDRRLLEGVLLDRGGAPAAQGDQAGPTLAELVDSLRLRLRAALAAAGPVAADTASGGLPNAARERLGEALAELDGPGDVPAALRLIDLARELGGAAAFEAPRLLDAIRNRLQRPQSPPAEPVPGPTSERTAPREAPAGADVYIAAARQERDRVELIERKLRAAGVRVWSEAGIALGPGFKEEFYRRVDSSRAILACWTGAGRSYGFLHLAAEAGRSRDCLISCTFERTDAPEVFVDPETADLSDWDGADDHPGWRKVLRAIRERLAAVSPEAVQRASAVKSGISTAAAVGPAMAFLCYAPLDGKAFPGVIGELPRRLEAEVRRLTGSDFKIFRNVEGIRGGDQWPSRLKEALGNTRFLIPILTPAFFNSEQCRHELEKCLELERERGRVGLILPIYLMTARELEQRTPEDPLAAMIRERRWLDLRDLRHRRLDSKEARRAIRTMAEAIARELARDTRDRSWSSPPASRVFRDIDAPFGKRATLRELVEAIHHYERSLEIARELGDQRAESTALGNLGLAYAELGEPQRAIEFHERALAIARELGDRRAESAELGNLGTVYFTLRELQRAIQYYEQRLAITREIGDRQGEAYALYDSAVVIDQLGERAEAIRRMVESLEIFGPLDPMAKPARAKLADWPGRA